MKNKNMIHIGKGFKTNRKDDLIQIGYILVISQTKKINCFIDKLVITFSAKKILRIIKKYLATC